MKKKLIAFFIVAGLMLPMLTSLFDLQARRRASFFTFSVVNSQQSVISPN